MHQKLKSLIFNYEKQNGIGFSFRKKRGVFIKDFLKKLCLQKKVPIKVLDVGGTENFWLAVGIDFLRKLNIQITLLNIELYPVKNTDIFTSYQGDATRMQFADNSFDLCFSNSVIEHVGDFENMMAFAKEMRRVAPYYYCQTPNFWFPVEPHFLFLGFQFLPEPVRVFLLTRFTLGNRSKQPDIKSAYMSVQSVKLIDFRAMAALFNDAIIKRERFLFLTKSLIAVRGLA